MAEPNQEQNQDQANGTGTTTEELVPIKDPKSGQIFQVPKAVQIAMNHTIEANRKAIQADQTGKMQELLKKLNDNELTAQQYAEKIQELEDANKTAEQRAADKLQRELKALTTERDQFKTQLTEKDNRLRSLIIEQTVGQAIAGHEVNDLTATMRLLLSDYQHEVKEENGSYSVVLRSTDGEELSPKDAVSQYLAREDRSFLLRSSLKPGSGSGVPGARRATDGATVFSREKFAQSKDVRDEYNKLKAQGVPVRLE